MGCRQNAGNLSFMLYASAACPVLWQKLISLQ